MDAVVLLSGGLDSYTAAAIAQSQGFTLSALTIRYGQRHAEEIGAASRIAAALKVERHLEMALDLRGIGGSALTSDQAVPLDRDLSATDIPSTYVPARNTIFLALALGWAEVIGAADIFIGVNALDYSGYPDCRPEYVAAFQRMANLATKGGVEGTLPVRIQTPLLQLTKRQIVELGVSLGVDYTLTLSCYDPTADGLACGRCDSCQLRRRGFAEAGVDDPTRYVASLD